MRYYYSLWLIIINNDLSVSKNYNIVIKIVTSEAWCLNLERDFYMVRLLTQRITPNLEDQIIPTNLKFGENYCNAPQSQYIKQWIYHIPTFARFEYQTSKYILWKKEKLELEIIEWYNERKGIVQTRSNYGFGKNRKIWDKVCAHTRK